ncbi:MAG: HNH endonuclease [Actinomycetota bacterium]|nr:HNH endonuclease [Actinomycetota bacterium]
MSLPRPCAEPGCPVSVTGANRCPDHAVDTSLRHGSRFTKLARRMKTEMPWCAYCGSPATAGNPLTIDHIVPLVHGGTNRRENLTVACRRCNDVKADATGYAPRTAPATTIVIA